MIKFRHSIRANRQYSKAYIDNILNQFTQLYVKQYELKRKPTNKIISTDFGKQDMRGAPSITLIDSRHCVPHQRHFATNNEILSYIEGYIDANSLMNF